MKKKILPLVLVSSLAMGATVALASCSGKGLAQEILARLTYDTTESVEADFKVAATMKHGEETYNLLWTSSNENVLKVADEAYEDSYTVYVTLPEDNVEYVTLTATLNINGDQATKEFEFHVDPISVYTISGAYKFKQKDAVVYEDFALDTVATYGSKQAEITWNSLTPALITIDNDAHMARVTTTAPAQKVKLEAVFSYNGKTSKKTYTVNVYRELTEFEKLQYWYQHTGITQDITGYIVAKDAYDSSKKCTNLYLSDNSGKGGYYAYRVPCTEEVYNTLAFGNNVTVSGAANSAYNGLMETTGGELKVNSNVPNATEADLLVAIDQEFIANLDTFYYRSSQLVSLTGWQVKTIQPASKTADTYGTAADLLTLKKGKYEIKVVSSKYVKLADGVGTALSGVCSGLQVNDYVDIKGVLGFNGTAYKQDGYRINVTDAASIVKNTSYNASGDTALIAAAENVKKALDGLSFGNVYKTNEFALPAELEGCAVTWSFSTPESIYNPSTVVIDNENHKLVVTPGENKEEAVLVATATNGGLTGQRYFKFITLAKTDEQLVDDEIEDFDIDIQYPGSYELPEVAELYNLVGIDYEILSQKNKAGEDVNVAHYEDGQLDITSLDKNDSYTIVIKATFSYGEVEKEEEYTLTITNEKIIYNEVQKTIDTTKSYILGVDQETMGKVLYFSGAESGNNLAVTTDYKKAAAVRVQANQNGTYYLYILDGTKKTYIVLEATAAGKANLQLSETPFEWKWNTTHNTFLGDSTFTPESGDPTTTEFFFGSFSKNDYLSPSAASSYLSSATSYKSHLLKVQELNYDRQEKVNFEKDNFEFEVNQKASDSYIKPTSKVFDDVVITWVVDSNDDTKASVDTDGNIQFSEDITEATTVKVNVTFTCAGKDTSKEITFNVAPVTFMTPTEIVNGTKGDKPSIVSGETKVFVAGIVTHKYKDKNPYISDGENEFELYGNLLKGNYNDVKIGDILYVSGIYKLFNTTHETGSEPKILKRIPAAEVTDLDKVIFTKNEIPHLPTTYEENQDEVPLPTVGTFYDGGDHYDNGEDHDTVTRDKVSISWTPIATTTTTIADNKLTITQGSADEEVTVVATITLGTTSVQKSFTFTVKKESNTKNRIMKGTTSINNSTLAANTDYASSLNLDNDIFDVVFAANDAKVSGNPVCGAIGTSYITTYNATGGNGTQFTISVASGYTIDKLVFTYNTADKVNGVLTVAGTALQPVTTTHNTDEVTLAANTTSVVVKNTGTQQVRIAQIVITYTRTV